jgi:hypothetical protein
MKGEVDYHRRLSADMAEAEHRAQINALDDKSAWEELCKIRDALGEKINQPTPPRNFYRAPLSRAETSHDVEFQNALRQRNWQARRARERGLSS